MGTRRAWGTLALLSFAELLGMSLWFTGSAAAPELAAAWGLEPAQIAWLTTAVQLGFVAGTAFAAISNTADLIPARTWFVASALLGAAANVTLAWSGGLAPALAGRFATGFFLAGVYPPAMKMIATWFRERRGLAIGTIVAALTVGKATPYLLEALPGRSVATIAFATSAAATLAALLVALGYDDGPHAFERRPFSWRLVHDVWQDRPTRLAIAGYLGHMWELYAMWALIALYFADVLAAGSHDIASAGLFGFAAIASGGAGAVLAGVWADRLGRERIAGRAMWLSGACSLVIGWMLDAPLAAVAAVALIWGFAIVADSAQFSALVTELAPRHAVGTALTLQTSLGFALTAIAIPFTAMIAQRFGWGVAFSQLAIGPALGIVAMHRLRALRSATSSAAARSSSGTWTASAR